VHLTETCAVGAVHLITHVETTQAHIRDADLSVPIHDALERKDLRHEHFIDSGYVDADLIVRARRRRDRGRWSVRPHSSWQARSGTGYDAAAFVVDWDHQTVTCPQGRTNRSWTPHQDKWGNAVIAAKFSRTDCRLGNERALCTRAATGPRLVLLRPQDDYHVLREMRRRQETAEWKGGYRRRRASSTLSKQSARMNYVRRAIGQAKTRLQHVLTALGLNLVRMAAWFSRPHHAMSRVSHFAALAPAPGTFANSISY
jgi:transposase